MSATRLKFGVAALVVLAGFATMTLEHRDWERLSAEHESLTHERVRLSATNKTLSNLAAQAKFSVSESNTRLAELLRLRGEAGELRQAANELAGLREENRKLNSQVAAEAGDAGGLSEEDRFTLNQKHAESAMNSLIAAVKNYAAIHNGQLPENFDELIASGELKDTNFDGNLSLNDFEFMQPGITDGNGGQVVLRNRIPVARPGQDPQWTYGTFGNGGTGMLTTSADLADTNVSLTRPSSPYSPWNSQPH
ncbi:MAG TPA: hypothetical protein VH595_18780 [Verrucomicrobiae bacterium]|nr:hypothetical protein [Verrucomicrobiae bacterium]